MYSDEEAVVSTRYVVAKRSTLNQDCGLVTILFEIDENNNFIPPRAMRTEQERLVWISRGYSEVNDQFRDGQSMLLENLHEQDKNSDTYQIAPDKNRAEYWATGKSIKAIPDSQIIPVIRAELPDTASGRFRTDELVPSGPIFIQYSDAIYGPFHAVRDDDEVYRAEPHQQMILRVANDHVAKFSRDELVQSGAMLEVDPEEGYPYRAYITDLRVLATEHKNFEQVDYITDAQLVTYYVKSAFGRGKSPLARKHADTLKGALAEQAKKTKILDDPRLSRFSSILDKFLSEKDPGEQIIHDWLSTPEGKAFAEGKLKANPALAGQSSMVAEKKQELDELQQQIDEFRGKHEHERRSYEQARNKLQNDLEQERIRREREIETSLKESEKNLTEKLGSEVQELLERKDALSQEIDGLRSDKKIVMEVAQLKEEVRLLERDKDRLRDAIRDQESTLKNPQLGRDVAELHWHLQVLNGQLGSAANQELSYSPSKLMRSKPENPRMLISAIANWFEVEGRAFTFEEMANLLITTQQSLMTVMKGRPGSGKTSSSIRLARALHIADESSRSDDFLNVPVSRGWVSGRDFLGYYNPLKGSFQPARTGIYQFIANGTREEADSTLRLILLDEANLSPIEHYLSDFIGMFDSEGRRRPLDTGCPGEDQYLPLPENIRFIATINSDGTTEPLSPRMCDRVPVISMDYEEPEGEDIFSDLTMDGAVPYGVLEAFFGVSAAGETNIGYTPLKLRNFMRKMTSVDQGMGRSIPISARKQNAIANYFAVAKEYLGETRAADFAIAQYLLPLVNGSGQAFGNRLKELNALAGESGFERTRHLLTEMVEIGKENIDNYSFF